MSTLVDAYPRQQERIRQCLQNGRELGPVGAFYCAMAEDLLRRADRAALGGDPVVLLAIYREMEQFKE